MALPRYPAPHKTSASSPLGNFLRTYALTLSRDSAMRSARSVSREGGAIPFSSYPAAGEAHSNETPTHRSHGSGNRANTAAAVHESRAESARRHSVDDTRIPLAQARLR